MQRSRGREGFDTVMCQFSVYISARIGIERFHFIGRFESSNVAEVLPFVPIEDHELIEAHTDAPSIKDGRVRKTEARRFDFTGVDIDPPGISKSCDQ